MEITSLKNDLVKYWVSLNDKKVRDKDKVFLVEGDHLVNEALKNNLVVYTISTIDSKADYLITDEIMKKISNQKSVSSIAALVKFIPDKDINGNVLILDGVQDPGNLGTIIRSAVAFNFKSIILSDTSVDLYNPKVVRATEGMIFNINVKRESLLKAIPELKSNGYEVIGTDVNEGKNIKSIPKKNVAIIIGNEGNGISSEVKELIDRFIYIPIDKDCESLNAGVAASIIMYEVSNE